MRFHFVPLGIAALFLQPLVANSQTMPLPTGGPILPVMSANPSSGELLTLPAAVERAFQFNPGLRSALRDIDIAKGQRIQAGKIPNPEVSYLSEGLAAGRRTTTLQLNQPIELGGKRRARIDFAEREQDIAEADAANYRANLRADVVTAFFEVLAAQERLTLAQASQELSQRATSAASRRVIAGKVSPVEETRARVAEASTKIELSQASNELAQAKHRLSATWGRKSPDFQGVQPPAVPGATHADTADLFQQVQRAPQFSRARLEVERQIALMQIERSRRVPNLTLSIGSKRDEQFGGRQTIVGVAIPLPLFDRNQGNLLSAARRTDKARDELAVVETRLSMALGQATLRLESASEELEILRAEILPGAHSTYEAAVKGFELGKFSFLDVLDAQRTLFQAKSQYIRALAESHRAAAEIERVVGTVEPHGGLVPFTTLIQESK